MESEDPPHRVYVYDNYREASLKRPYTTAAVSDPTSHITEAQREALREVARLAEGQHEELYALPVRGKNAKHIPKEEESSQYQYHSATNDENPEEEPEKTIPTTPIFFLHIPQPLTLQTTLLKLWHLHPPPTGNRPRILLSPNWSHPSRPPPETATTLALIPSHPACPNTDILCLFTAKKHSLSYLGGNRCLRFDDCIKGVKVKGVERFDIFWAGCDFSLLGIITAGLDFRGLRGPDLSHVDKKRGLTAPNSAKLQPFGDSLTVFAGSDERVPLWLGKAEKWWKGYKVPMEDEVHCVCRRSAVERGKKGEGMVSCGGRCGFGWWHFGCAGIKEGTMLEGEGEWLCPKCREGSLATGKEKEMEIQQLKPGLGVEGGGVQGGFEAEVEDMMQVKARRVERNVRDEWNGIPEGSSGI